MWRTILVSVVSAVLASVLTAVIGWAVIYPPAAEAQSRTLRTELLEITGANGVTRAIIGTLENGDELLMINNDRGQRRLSLSVTSEGTPKIAFYGPSQEERATLAIGGDSVSFTLMDANGRPRLMQVVTDSGFPVLLALDERGNGFWSAP